MLFSDGSIAYYEDKAARLLGQEREKIVMTAASSVWSIPSEEGRFTIREGTGRDRVWVFEADDDDERDDWVRHISAHASNSSNGRAPGKCLHTRSLGTYHAQHGGRTPYCALADQYQQPFHLLPSLHLQKIAPSLINP